MDACTVDASTSYVEDVAQMETNHADPSEGCLVSYFPQPLADYFASVPATSPTDPSLQPKPRVYQYAKAGKTATGAERPAASVLELNEVFTACDPKFIVHNEADRTFLVFNSYTDYRGWFAHGTLRSLHEVIRGSQPQRLKFDIDAAADKLDALEEVEEPWGGDYDRWQTASKRTRKAVKLFEDISNAIIECFYDLYGKGLNPDYDFAISDSTDEAKFSRHIVIWRFHVKNNEEANFFTKRLLALLPADVHPFLDAGVNRSMQNFRLVNNHKVGSSRVKRCIQGADDLLTVTQVDGTIALPALNVRVEKQLDQSCQADEKAVRTMAAEWSEGLVYRNRVDNMFCYKRVSPGHCRICDRVHDADNTLFVTVKQGFVRVHCRRPSTDGSIRSICIGHVGSPLSRGGSPAAKSTGSDLACRGRQAQSKKYGDDLIKREFKPCAAIPPQFSVERYNKQYIREFDFHDDRYDTLLIKANMGTGKTKQLIQYIKTVPAATHIVLVSFRRSFTSEIIGKLGEGFVSYREAGGQITAPRVVVQFDSLHRLKLPAGKQLLLVLDESESVIEQIESGLMKAKGLRLCWEKFEWLAVHATRLIAMDAFADYRTFSLLAQARKAVYVYHNTYLPDSMPTDFYYEEKVAFLDAIYRAAPEAKASPFVIISTAKKQSDAIVAKLRTLYPDTNIRSYSADSTTEDRMDFEDVSAAWADVHILVFTSTITAGCSYERPRFKKCFAYFSDRTVDYKTSIQMLGRVRDIASREYHIFIKDHPKDLPDTVEEVEKAMAQRKEIYGMKTNLLKRPTRFSDTADEREFVLKDLYYHLHVGNIVHRCQSRNRFRELFQQHRAMMGVKLVNRSVEIPQPEAIAISIKHKETVEQLVADEHSRIAGAPAIDAEEAERLSHVDCPTIEQRDALTVYRLAETYHVPRSVIGPAFVETYSRDRVKQNHRFMRRLGTEKGTIADVIGEWQRQRDQSLVGTQGSIDDFIAGDDLLRCKIAAGILDELLPEQDGRAYCSTTSWFKPVTIDRGVLEERLGVVMTGLQANAELIGLKFGIKKAVLLAKRLTLKAKLSAANSILDAAFGVKIAAVKEEHKPASNVFKLLGPRQFRWLPASGRYTADPTALET